MIIRDHIEEIMFTISDLGNTDVYIGHEWFKIHNPDIDWEKSCIFMTWYKPSCQFVDNLDIIDNDDTETLVDEEKSPLEDGDDTTAVSMWSEQPHYKYHSRRLKCEERVTCLLQWKGGRMSV